MSPMAKMCGTLVRICRSTGMKPRSLTSTPAASAPMFLPFGLRPTAISTLSYTCGSTLRLGFEGHAQAFLRGFDLADLGLDHDAFVALRDALLQRPHEVAIAARHQAIGELDDADLHAERVVHRRHFQTDDAAADDQHALRQIQFERAGRIDDARIVRQSGKRTDSEPAAMMQCANETRRAAPLPVTSISCGETNLPVPRMTSTLRCFASVARPPVSLPTTLFFHSRSFAASICGLPKCMPALPSLPLPRSPSQRAATPWTECSRR